MKKTLFILFFTALFISCNQSSNQKDSDKGDSHDHHETTELTLNNGAKWQADTMTNLHLLRLKSIANQFKDDPNPAIEQYHILSSDVKEELNSLIKDCTLKGATDEALHKWMHPILSQILELKNTSDTSIAKPVFDSLDQRINIYFDYFE